MTMAGRTCPPPLFLLRYTTRIEREREVVARPANQERKKPEIITYHPAARTPWPPSRVMKTEPLATLS